MRNRIKNLIDWLFDKSSYIASISFVVLTIIDISSLNEWTINAFGIPKLELGKFLYYTSVVFALIFGVKAISSQVENTQLESKNKEQSEKIRDLENSLSEVVNETNELFNSYLKLLVKNLNFTHNERISVYKTYNNEFRLIGRTSVNPNLAKRGRTSYPITDGFIGKGWAEGEFFIQELPSPKASNGRTYYNKINGINQISRSVIDNLNMKSRNFFIYRINGFDNSPKAVLVFESLEPSAFTKEHIIEKLAGVKQPLVMFIEKNNGVKLLENNALDL
ncbi:hypothetical protein [uncultured Polaribacter sp.]|uniref:hypothetical protein n=1 Tax=uncultured Polaribacter sp. TaxID=174711 RepID=UPI0026191494|nr:hypothetical protein [uncultured Polaribacter sp.]